MYTILLAVFCIVLNPASVVANPDDASDLKVDLVQVIFRHGDRTPLYSYGKDPNVNETYYPYGWSSLDKSGRQRTYNLGLSLKKLYRDFIFDYDPNEVTIWSTISSRTKASAQIVAAGLFPPKTLKWDIPGSLGNIWLPTSLDSVDNPLNDEHLIYKHAYPCPAYFQLIHEQNNGPPLEWLIQSDPELVQAYTENTGSRDVYLISYVYDTLMVHEKYGLKFADWVQPFYPDRFKAFTEKTYYMYVRTEKMTRLRIGSLVGHIIKQMDLKAQGSKKKFWLYSGHDTTIYFLGKAFRIWEEYMPDLSSAMIIELLSNSRGRQFVSIYMHNDTSPKPIPLTVPGCGTLCPLNQFRKLFDEVIPANLAEECIQVDEDGQRFYNPPDGWLF